jgi:hypothetical protein
MRLRESESGLFTRAEAAHASFGLELQQMREHRPGSERPRVLRIIRVDLRHEIHR